MKKTTVFFSVGVCLLFIIQSIQGQAIIRRYDWDSNTTLGAPTVAVTQTPSGGVCAYTGVNGVAAGTVTGRQNDGTASGTVGPVGSTYGVDSAVDATAATAGLLNSSTSNAFYNVGGNASGAGACATPRRIVEVTFPAISGTAFTGGGISLISYRSAFIASDIGTSGSGPDQSDRVLLAVSLDGGATFNSQIALTGNANVQIDYNPANTFSQNYNSSQPYLSAPAAQPAASTSYTSGSTSAQALSRGEIRIPVGAITAASSVVLKFIIQTDRGDELVTLDDVIVSQFIPTAASSSVKGRVTDEAGRGINAAGVSALNVQTGETKIVKTNPFGFYNFSSLDSGGFYILSVNHKSYKFADNYQSFSLNDDVQDVNFIGRSVFASPKILSSER